MLLHAETQSIGEGVPARIAVGAELLVYELHALKNPEVHHAWAYVEPNEITGQQGHLRPTEAYDILSARTPKEKAQILFPHFKAIAKIVLAETDRVDLAGDFSLVCAVSTRLDPGFHELLEVHRQSPGNENATVMTMLVDTLPPPDVVNGVLDEVERAKRVSSTLMRYLANLPS